MFINIMFNNHLYAFYNLIYHLYAYVYPLKAVRTARLTFTTNCSSGCDLPVDSLDVGSLFSL